jgi:hypothetical protein
VGEDEDRGEEANSWTETPHFGNSLAHWQGFEQQQESSRRNRDEGFRQLSWSDDGAGQGCE